MKRTIIDATQFELEDKVVAIKRVSKTVKGGRTMRFSALVVVIHTSNNRECLLPMHPLLPIQYLHE